MNIVGVGAAFCMGCCPNIRNCCPCFMGVAAYDVKQMKQLHNYKAYIKHEFLVNWINCTQLIATTERNAIQLHSISTGNTRIS